MFMYIHVHVYLYITYMYTHKNIIAEREARQQIWLRGEKCELVYMCIYTFVCNASGMQLSECACPLVEGVARMLHVDGSRSAF